MIIDVSFKLNTFSFEWLIFQGLTYIALYDYDAQDDDEVGFQENDKIVDCEVIDEGWITGTVERTGRKGMIPANYVEPA